MRATTSSMTGIELGWCGDELRHEISSSQSEPRQNCRCRVVAGRSSSFYQTKIEMRANTTAYSTMESRTFRV